MEEVRNPCDRRMPNLLRKFSDLKLRPFEMLKEDKTNLQMKAVCYPLRKPESKRPVDPSTYPFILEGELASPEKIQDIGRLPEVPKIEETVTITDDGQEIRTVQFCRVPKDGFLKIINRAEFDTVLILLDGVKRYGRIMVKGSDKEGI